MKFFRAPVCGPSVLLFLAPFFAHATLLSREPLTLDAVLHKISIVVAITAAVLILFLTIVALCVRNQSETMKKILFISLLVAIVLPTIFFIGSTMYSNSISDTKGPVHWHADFEIYACGQPIRLSGPASSLSNKVGTPTFHHHDDNRMHVEGVVIHREDFELQDFFATIGGELTNTSFSLPTESGIRELRNGDFCADSSTGAWQVFVYRQDIQNPSVFRQEKLASYTDYILSPHQKIPPGDCIIIEFDVNKARTEHLCTFYTIEAEKGAISIK